MATLIFGFVCNWTIAWVIWSRPITSDSKYTAFDSPPSWPPWAPRDWPPLGSFTTSKQLAAYKSLVNQFAPRSIQILPVGSRASYAIKTQLTSFGSSDTQVLAVRYLSDDSLQLLRAQRRDAGFPFFSVTLRSTQDMSGTSWLDLRVRDIWKTSKSDLPLSPILGGTIVNTICYGLCAYLILILIFQAIPPRFKSNTRCTKCDYNTFGLLICPECGTPTLPPKS